MRHTDPDGGGFKCDASDFFDILTMSVVPGTLVGGLYPEDLILSVTTKPVMMLAGVARPWFLDLPGLPQNWGGGRKRR
jgi:hypothetical protein